MQVLEKGQYLGVVKDMYHGGGIIAAITSYDKENFDGSLHYHDNAHISFVLEGASLEKRGASYDRSPGKVTYYSAGEPHQLLRIYRQAKHINLELEESFFRINHVSDGILYSAITKNPDAGFLTLKIYNELMAADDCSIISVQMLLMQFIGDTKRQQVERAEPAWVKKIRELLHEHWNENITLQQLSEKAGIHPVSISQYFPAYFSCTLGQYMRKLKVAKAMLFIKADPVSLTDIAYECGFADQSHFTRTFKAVTGFLPNAYRKL